MSCRPPESLRESLDRLELVSAASWRAAGVLLGRRARGRASRELARFESAWLDALVQLRALTPYQAAALRAGRAESLRVGPHVIYDRAPGSRLVPTYRARETASGAWRLLAVFPSETPAPTAAANAATPWGDGPATGNATTRLLENLERLAQWRRHIEHPALALIDQFGRDGATIWAAARWVEGRSLAEWLVRRGRFPAPAVEDIVRQAADALAALHHAGCCHGDLDADTIVLDHSGQLALVLPGLYSAAPADAAVEFPSKTTRDPLAEPPPTPADDLAALGRAAWVALMGRPVPPGFGGSAPPGAIDRGAARVQLGPLAEITRLRGQLSEGLFALLSTAVESGLLRAGMSAAELAVRAGSGAYDQRRALVASLAESGAGRGAVPQWLTRLRGIAIAPRWVAGVLIGLVATALLGWWLIYRGDEPAPSPLVSRTVAPSQVATSAGPITSQSPSGAEAASIAAASGAPGGDSAGRAVGSSPPGVAGPSRPVLRSGSSPPVSGAAPGPPGENADEIVLGAEEPLTAASLPIRGGRTLRGAPGGARPTVVIDGDFAIDADDVRFVDLDFVWRGADALTEPQRPASARDGTEQSPAEETEPATMAVMIRLRAATATFERCTFSIHRAEASDETIRRVTAAAMVWENAGGEPADPLALPGGRLRLVDCVLCGLDGGVRCRRDGARRIELDNVLALDVGALVRLDRAAAADEPTLLRLARVTLRGGGPLLECRFAELPETPGRIAVGADACAFAPAPETALLSFRGRDDPSRWIERIEWLGADSFLTDGSALIDFRASGDSPRRLDDAAIRVTGLVRSALGFAGAVKESVAASALTRWQGPTRSPRPPGADPSRLPPIPGRQRGRPRVARSGADDPSSPGKRLSLGNQPGPPAGIFAAPQWAQ